MLPEPSVRIVVATRPVDFRRGHDALAATAAGDLGLDIYSGVIVIFRSKRGDRLKMLAWDGTGLVLTYKRLEEGRFAWPRIGGGGARDGGGLGRTAGGRERGDRGAASPARASQ